MATPGQLIVDDRFALEVQHKRGGMGTVWRARDLRTSRPVAVKILHGAVAEQAERFIREAKLLADLADEAIVAHVAHGTTAEGVPYLAMEWLDGENVAERLARKPLTLLESLTLAWAAGRGLAVAHRRGIVHRDIKPSNLFLRRGRVDDVVLLDLGIARHLNGADPLTQTGSILGTPSYMAPEQAQGVHDVSPAVDVFSLGCVLFECLTGDPPFVGEHVFAVLAKLLFEDPPRLQDLRPELPAAVDALLARMLAKEPGRRVRDGDALLATLAALGGVLDVEAPRATAAPPRPPASEQELVSVILATRDRRAADDDSLAGGPTLLPGQPSGAAFPDVAVYGAEMKRLADGTTVITLPQRGGAATDLAARAARCALRLRESRSTWTIVLATGRGIPSERMHIGEAVDRAGSMLRARADRGGGWIWLDEATAGLLDARFHTRRLDDDTMFALEGEDASIDPTRPLLGRPTACVGREHELGTLELALRACIEESAPRAVLVVGLPGMGKSRMRHELVRRAQAHGDDVVVLLGLGDPIRTSSTRGLLGSAVSRLCGIRAGAPPAENRAALEDRIGRHLTADRHRTPVFIGELVGVHYPSDEVPELRAARQNPAIMADLIAQAWVTFLRAEAAVHPVLLALDDLQWSDALTLSLVDAALRDLGSSPLMVLALARPEALELFPDLWAPRLAVMPLRPLGAAAMARLVRHVLGDQVSDAAVERIVARAAGNALYLEELIRAAEAKREAVPETVLAMLQARIGLLPASARRFLRAASVFGESFPLAGVEALVRATGHDDVPACLRALAKHEIVELQPHDRGANRWRFRHVLMRDAAYGLLTAEDRVAAHAGAARFLEAAGEEPAVVASHCERGGDLPGAVRHYTAAAKQAYRRNDLASAIALVNQGIACGARGEERGVLGSIEAPTRWSQNDFAAGLAASGEALALLPPGHPKRIDCLSSSIFCGVQLGRTAELEPQLEEMLATDPGEEDRADYVSALGYASLACAALASRGQASPFLTRIAVIDAQYGDGDALVRGHALYWRLRFLQLLGDDPYEPWVVARQCVDSHERSGDRRMLARAHAEVGECARRLFSVDEGVKVMRRAVELVRGIREPVPTAFVTQRLAILLAEHGAPEDLAEARALGSSVIENAGQARFYRAMGQVALALVSLREGDPATAEPLARAAHATVRALALRGYFPHVDAPLLTVLVAAGVTDGVGALADEALALLDSLGPMGLIELSLRLAAARAHLHVGRRDDAARGIAVALACLERRAALVPDPALREAFLTRIPEHVGVRELARELGVAGG